MKFIVFVFLFFACFLVRAQQNEIGVLAGVTYYIGDINPSVHFNSPKPAVGIIYRNNINKRISFRSNIIRGTLFSADSKVKYNTNRNLHFKSSLTELACIVEINYLKFLPGVTDYKASTYVFGGLSFFMFNPKALYDGTWHELQPLRTEGYDNAYPRYNIGIPFGMGMKFNISKYVALAVEWGLRKTFSDYIDDISKVYPDSLYILNAKPLTAIFADRSPEINMPANKAGSQRGNSSTKDYYSFAGISLTIKIKNKKPACNAFEKRKDYNRIINFDKSIIQGLN